MPHRNLLLLFATVIVSYACYVRAEQNPYARYVAAGYSFIDRLALQEPSDQKLFEGAMRGMIEVLRRSGDEHSAFVNEKQRDEFREGLTQQFGGVGVRIRMLGDPKMPTVVGPPKVNSPAASVGMRSGDQIIAIDGQSTEPMSMDDVLKLIRGPVGAPLSLTLRRLGEAETIDVSLDRAIIVLESIWGDLHGKGEQWQFRLAEDSRLALIRITTFGDKTVDELTRVLAELTAGEQADPIEGLILDVRDNAGGALDAAVDISDLFLRAGQTIVTTRGRDRAVRDRFVSTGNGGYTRLPLAILINQNSASASEIVAACLQDYGRAAIVGQRSYGKGTVQRLERMESGRSLLKITSATYWRPSEQNIHRMPGDTEQSTWGVSPDRGYQVTLDDQQYVDWRRYRSRRDLPGTRLNEQVSRWLDEADGALPTDYVDEALVQAIEYLRLQLTEVAETYSL
ncbi:MAG: S41 family peptidase [Planctomycetota bacterium]